jgi:hypothetical protein
MPIAEYKKIVTLKNGETREYCQRKPIKGLSRGRKKLPITRVRDAIKDLTEEEADIIIEMITQLRAEKNDD